MALPVALLTFMPIQYLQTSLAHKVQLCFNKVSLWEAFVKDEEEVQLP